MAEKYLHTFSSGNITVQFNISPEDNLGLEIGSVTAGDVIYISGRIRDTGAKINNFSMCMVSGSTAVSNTVTVSSIARDTWRKFSASLEINSTSGGRGERIYLKFTVDSRLASEYTNYYYTFYSYYVEPRVVSLILQRCKSDGSADNEGSYVKCSELRIKIGDSARYTDITKMEISTSPSVFSKTYDSTNGLSSIVQSAVTSYYSDSSPSDTSALLGGKTFPTDTDYDIIIKLTAGSETSTYRTSVSRSFAKLHIAGNPSGGVAIGMFSTSDTDVSHKPKFEVASSHDTYFKGPVYFEQPVEFKSTVSGIQSQDSVYVSGDTPTGKTWIDGRPIYRLVLTGDTNVSAGSDAITLHNDIGDISTIISVTGSLFIYDRLWQVGLGYVGKGGDLTNIGVRFVNSTLAGTTSAVLVVGEEIKGEIRYVIIIEHTRWALSN